MKKIGEIKGVPVVEGDANLVKNQILYKETDKGISLSKRTNGKLEEVSGGGGGGDSEEKEWYYCKCPNNEVLAILKGYVAVDIPNPKGEGKIITEADTIVVTYGLDDIEFVGYARFLKEEIVVYDKTDSKSLNITKFPKDYVEHLLNQVGVEFITKDEYFSKIDIKFEDYPYVEAMY